MLGEFKTMLAKSNDALANNGDGDTGAENATDLNDKVKAAKKDVAALEKVLKKLEKKRAQSVTSRPRWAM